MTNLRLAEAFLDRARARLKALDGLRSEADFSDVIREARDIVELCLRGILRISGIVVSRWMDVGDVLQENRSRLPADARAQAERAIEIYRDLGRERPIALPEEGSAPVEKVLAADADRAIADAEWVLGVASLTVDLVAHRRVPSTPGR
ncbi:MAG TPA: HEPN domain-containing protein [Candidatus Polarisedimenticolia bacterium]|nr:HEPN domain-containing protein [Candidatus Polarisedimenticolia bacterium]